MEPKTFDRERVEEAKASTKNIETTAKTKHGVDPIKQKETYLVGSEHRTYRDNNETKHGVTRLDAKETHFIENNKHLHHKEIELKQKKKEKINENDTINKAQRARRRRRIQHRT